MEEPIAVCIRGNKEKKLYEMVISEKQLCNIIKESVKKVIMKESVTLETDNEVQEEDSISKSMLMEWIEDEVWKLVGGIGHDRIDAYNQGVIDGFKKVYHQLKGD